MLGIISRQKASWAAPLLVAMVLLSLFADNAFASDPWEIQAHHAEVALSELDGASDDAGGNLPSHALTECHLSFVCLTFVLDSGVLLPSQRITGHFPLQPDLHGDGVAVPGLLRPPSFNQLA